MKLKKEQLQNLQAINKNIVDKYQHKSIDSKKIFDFLNLIAANNNYDNSFKMIYTLNVRNKEDNTDDFIATSPKLACYFKQNDLSKITAVKFHTSCNYYITKNSFTTMKQRNNEYLFSLDNIVIDIDLKKEYLSLSTEQLQQSTKKLYEILNSRLGLDCTYIRTAHGLHIWLHLQSCSAKLKWLYTKNIQALIQKINDIFDETNYQMFNVDNTASLSAEGIIRLPYCIHNNKTLISAYKITDTKYDINELTKILQVNINKSTNNKNKQKTYNKKNYSVVYTSLHTRRMEFITDIVKANKNNVVGRRNNLLWVYYNEAVQAYDISVAKQKTIELNKTFNSSLSETQLKNIMKAVDKVHHYALNNSKFLEKINATTVDIEEYRLINFTQHERKERAANNRNKRNERNKTIEQMYYAEKISVEKIAELLNCSISVVRNVISETSKQVKENRNKQIIYLYEENYTQKEIAEIMHLCTKTVRKVISNHIKTADIIPISIDC